MGGMPAAEVAPGGLVPHLDGGGEPVEEGEQLLPQPRRRSLVDGDEGGPGAALLGLPQRLTGPNPGSAGRRRRGEDGQAELGDPTEDHGFGSQLGMAAPGDYQSEMGKAGAEEAGLAHLTPPHTAGRVGFPLFSQGLAASRRRGQAARASPRHLQ